MARRNNRKFQTPHERYQEHKRIAKLIFIFALVGIFFLIVRDRQRIWWWLESLW